MTAQQPLISERPKAPKKMTERQVLDLLRQRFVKPGNGGAGEYAYMEHVRNAAAFNANRTFDAVVMNLWPSRGLEIHAFEVKCSRSDWLRELKEPAKAEAAAKLVDRFYLVAANDTIVLDGELPPTWGLMVVKGGRLVCVKEAPLLPEANPKGGISRSFLVCLLRAGGAVPKAEASEVEAARRQGQEDQRGIDKGLIDSAKQAYDDLRAEVVKFEKVAGVRLQGWYGRDGDPERIGRTLRAVLEGEDRAAKAQEQIERVRRQLLQAADDLGQYVTTSADPETPIATTPQGQTR